MNLLLAIKLTEWLLFRISLENFFCLVWNQIGIFVCFRDKLSIMLTMALISLTSKDTQKLSFVVFSIANLIKSLYQLAFATLTGYPKLLDIKLVATF